MFLYHVAGAVLVFRYVFRDPKVDIRFLVTGAVLPNLVDKPLAWLLPAWGADRLIGHSLLFSTTIMVGVLIGTRRGRRRRAWMAMAIGAMIHLVLDGMWASAGTFLWPFLGWSFDQTSATWWTDLPGRLLVPLVAVKEVAGVAYLAYLWNKTGLSDATVRSRFVATGRLVA
ncbi:MAG: metal-dependent hydrolase [Acidimicrobiia bacterium]|nr:metal-dependent hydrolase [Acidimicrobiia bacterium]